MQQHHISPEHEFSDEKVRFKVERRPSCIVAFVVEALAPLVKEAHEKIPERAEQKKLFQGCRRPHDGFKRPGFDFLGKAA